MKNNRLCCAVCLLLVVLSLSAFVTPEQSGKTSAIRYTYTGLNTYASFNDSYMQCLGRDGTYYWSAVFQTFASAVYPVCRSQMLADLDFLSRHNVRTIRLWPVLSTFAYDNTTQTWSSNFNSSIKPVIHGEVGVYGTQYDQHGNDCEGTGVNAYRNVLPAMSSYCQAIWLTNAQAFVQQARIHNIQALFFQMWPATKAYSIRLYHSTNTFAGYQLTSAGKYVLSLAN